MKTRPIHWLFALLLLWTTGAAAALDPAVIKKLVSDDSDEKIAAIGQLLATGDKRAEAVLRAMSDDALFVSGDTIFYYQDDKNFNALTGEEMASAPEGADSVVVNNRVRARLDNAIAAFDLLNPDRDKRLTAAKALQSNIGPSLIPVLEKALAQETDKEIKKLLTLAHAQAKLHSEDAKERLTAVQELGKSDTAEVKSLLLALLQKNGDAYAEPDPAVRDAAKAAIKSIEAHLAWSDALGNVFSGLSLGSILLLAALGLAITYGVMGVINMAHGELLMVGAYTTYAVQSLFRAHFPALADYYVIAAIPAAFAVAALVGVLLERVVIRHLYGRPLETLLATWGISLFLIQAARAIFGPQNVEVGNPDWMSGGVEVLANVVLPWNRVIIIGFAVGVLALVWLLMTKTRLGLYVRAVTQNRPMASCVGVPTGRIDMLAFGLGAGIAGLGGVALSQISNVGPDMGQGYIVDSFMVVVLGGVGQLAGAVWAALGLGILTKFLEGWTGAVIAKILVLVFIILFIQKRPQGLFALKGRFVEA
jgi:urea transport system permease protein